MSAQEVIPLGARTLDELAISANENHAKMQDAAHQMLDYAIRIGGDLNEARGHFTLGKEFEPWVREHVNLSMPYARSLMRLSHYKDHLPVSADGMSIDRALAYISGLPRITTWQKGPARRINWEEARLLRDKGLSYPEIAGLLGCAVSTAYSICLPESERKANERNNRRKRARKQKALREATLKSQMKAMGGDLYGSYSLVRRALQRAQDAISQVNDKEARQAISRAMARLYEAEDELTKAVRAD